MTKSKTPSTVYITKWISRFNKLYPSIILSKKFNLRKLSSNWGKSNMISWKVGLLPVQRYSSIMDKLNSLNLKICLLSCPGFMEKNLSTLGYIKSKSPQQGSLLSKTLDSPSCKRQTLTLTLTRFIKVSSTESQEGSNSSKVTIFKLLSPNLPH